jgi:predicted nuclease of predicted toxin-antitoxin system
MSLGYYFDHHVPAAIADGVRRRGIDVLTALEDNTSDWDDEAILQRASELNRLVFTQDLDFLAIAHRWATSNREFCGIVFAHQLGITIGQAINELELIATCLGAGDVRNRVEYLPLR